MAPKRSPSSDQLELLELPAVASSSSVAVAASSTAPAGSDAALHMESTARQLAQQEHTLLLSSQQLQTTLTGFAPRLDSMQQELNQCHQRMQEISTTMQQVQQQTDKLVAQQLLEFAKENQRELQELQQELRQEQAFWHNTSSAVAQFQQQQQQMQLSLMNVQAQLRRVRQQKNLLAASALHLGLGPSLVTCKTV